MSTQDPSQVALAMTPPFKSLEERHATERNAECQAACRSWRVRTWLMVLLAAFTACSMVNMGITFFAMFKGIPYWSVRRASDSMEIGLVVVPRLVMLIASWFCVVTFSASLLWFREEPTLHLSDYMEVHQYPAVDVFLPRYTEEWNLYGPVVMAALAMDYPVDRLVVHVCDDGARGDGSVRPMVEPLMARYPNLRYVTRSDGKDAKAGNLNNALALSSNELIVVLDADHCAKPDFLLRTIPHLLAKERGHRIARLSDNVAFVQTTQVFHNEGRALVRMLDGSHALFYKLMMASYGGMGCAMCVGTGYVMQRVALHDIGGGYVSGCAVEDVVTALAMHDRGWTSKYLECRLVIGLSPETLSEFFSQRERWVAGSAQLLLYKSPLKMKHVPVKQRLAYLVGSWYWLLMLGFLVLILLRLTMWVIYRVVGGNPTTTGLPLMSEYIPVYLMFLLLPCVSFTAKLANIAAVFTFFPTYVSVAFGWVTQRLNPDKHTFRVTASSEAFGDAWPKLANINLGFVIVMSLVYTIGAIPRLNVYTTAFDWLVPTVFLAWTYLVNLPVLYDVGRRVVLAVGLAIHRLVLWIGRRNQANASTDLALRISASETKEISVNPMSQPVVPIDLPVGGHATAPKLLRSITPSVSHHQVRCAEIFQPDLSLESAISTPSCMSAELRTPSVSRQIIRPLKLHSPSPS
jgi:cellulose synthase (UDP-forming)